MAGRYCSRCGTARGDTSATAPLVVCPGCGWVEASDRNAVRQPDQADSPTVSASNLPPPGAHATVSLHKPAAPDEQYHRPSAPPPGFGAPYGSPYGPPPSSPQRTAGGRGRWLAAGAAVVVLGAAIGIVLAVGSGDSTPAAGPDSVAATPTPSTSDAAGKARDTGAAAATTTVVTTMPTPAPTVPVTVSNIDLAAVADHPKVVAVAQLLDTYFTGINDHDAARAASVFASDGAINPDSPRAVAAFSRAIRTTTDDLIAVSAIRGSTNLRVKASFRSRQAASLGPDGQTCTRWNLTYVLRGSASGDLQLLKSVDVTSRGC